MLSELIVVYAIVRTLVLLSKTCFKQRLIAKAIHKLCAFENILYRNFSMLVFGIMYCLCETYRYRVTRILIAFSLELVFFAFIVFIGMYLAKIIQLCLVLRGYFADIFLFFKYLFVLLETKKRF